MKGLLIAIIMYVAFAVIIIIAKPWAQYSGSITPTELLVEIS